MSTHDFYEGVFTTHEEADDIEALLAGEPNTDDITISVYFLKQAAMRIRQLEREIKQYEESSM